MKYRRKPEVIEAITFGDLILHGAHECEKAGQSLGPNAMPWSFSYAGHPVTHENDSCYLISMPDRVVRFDRGDMLINDGSGVLYTLKPEAFTATFELGD